MHYGWITLTQLPQCATELYAFYFTSFFFKSVLFPTKLVFKYKCIGIHHRIAHRTLMALHNVFNHFYNTVHYIPDLLQILNIKQC